MQFFKLNKKIEYFLLFLILIFAACLRLFRLEEVPSGFYVDEAALGYNAFSILKTGKDEYGEILPVIFKSFGDYKPGLYVYLSIPFVAVFGPNVFSVRFLSAFSGIVNVLLFYLIVKNSNWTRRTDIALLGTFLFSIIPWNIFFSRGAFEANLALTLFMVSIYLFLLARSKIKLLYLAIGLLSLSTYAYQAQRLVAYIFLFGVITIFFRKRIWKREVILPLFLFFLIQIPQLVLLTTPAFTVRASGLFYKDVVINQAEKILFLPKAVTFFLAFLREFLAQGTAYLSPKNLFFLPDSDPQRSIPELSVFYSWMIAPFLVGIFFNLRRVRKNLEIVILLIVAAVVPASLTGDPFSSLRSLPLVIPFSLIITKGMESMAEKGKGFFWIFASLIIVASMIVLWRSYFVLFPDERAGAWDYGYEKLAHIVESNSDKVFVIDQSRQNPSYILMAYFMKYPPSDFVTRVDPGIKENYYREVDFSNYYKFANVETRSIYWEEDVYRELILVGDELAVSESQAKEHSLKRLFEIKDPIDRIVFVGYQTQPELKCKSIDYENKRCRKLN